MPPKKSSQKVIQKEDIKEPESNEFDYEDDADSIGTELIEDLDAADDAIEDTITAEDSISKDPKSTSKSIQIPALLEVSDAVKEKYEYKPAIQSHTVYVHPDDRITSEIMTKFEYCEVVSIRSKQIEDGAQPFIDIDELSDPIQIAKKEIAYKKCPLSIIRHRTITDGNITIAELWQVNEMATPTD